MEMNVNQVSMLRNYGNQKQTHMHEQIKEGGGGEELNAMLLFSLNSSFSFRMIDTRLAYVIVEHIYRLCVYSNVSTSPNSTNVLFFRLLLLFLRLAPFT